MSASQIPNLLAGRGGPRSRGGRGRGRGQFSASGELGGSATIDQHRKDLNVQSTDTDAAVSRLSAVSVGYLNDPYAAYFVNGPLIRRLPIINRGTYTRTTALDILINAFLAEVGSGDGQQTKQIISLGAGTDTRYFRIRSQNRHKKLIYHEFDFTSVCEAKRRIVASNDIFSGSEDEHLFVPKVVGDRTTPDQEWGFESSLDNHAEVLYCCHPLDLRQLPSLEPTTKFRGLRTDLPTLIISECCLCYLETDNARDVVKWFVDKIPSLGIILYEPIGFDDSFGQMMVANLAARNIVMPSFKLFKTIRDQKMRLSDLGFNGDIMNSGQEAETVENIWADWIPAEEKERVDGLEGLDEVEEWQMLARHYAVAWGWKGIAGWEGWVRLHKN